LALLLFCAPLDAAQSGEAEQSHLSSGLQIVRARAPFEQGAHGEALWLLRPLVGNHPDQIVLFLYGISAIAAAERMDSEDEWRGALLREATLAMHAVRVTNPNLMRVRMGFVRALFLR